MNFSQKLRRQTRKDVVRTSGGLPKRREGTVRHNGKHSIVVVESPDCESQHQRSGDA